MQTDQKELLSFIRSLSEAFLAFESASAEQIRKMGLTPDQFDVLATLGNTSGMGCKELGAKTLITKGTLTGVLDRMEAKGWVRRKPGIGDQRSVKVELTDAGQALFEESFPKQVAWLSAVYGRACPEKLARAGAALDELRALMAKPGGPDSAD